MEYTNEYKVILSSKFKMELEEIYEYITFSLREYTTADKLYIKVSNSVLDLDFFPERYSRIYGGRRYKDKVLRKILINKYIVVFAVDNNTRTSQCITYISW